MADLAQLTAWRDALMAARYQGVRTVEYDGKRVTYATDSEMAAALGDLNRQITGTTSAHRRGPHPNPRKGFDHEEPYSEGRRHHSARSRRRHRLWRGGDHRQYLRHRRLCGRRGRIGRTGHDGRLSTAESHRRRADGPAHAWLGTTRPRNINVPGTGRFPVGIATEAAGNGITSVAVRLDGIGDRCSMMERDIRAVLHGLTLLVADTKGASQLDAMRNYATIMALCADLRKSATEYNGTSRWSSVRWKTIWRRSLGCSPLGTCRRINTAWAHMLPSASWPWARALA